MDLLTVVLVLLVVGVLLWLVNRYAAPVVDGKILTIINAVVVIAVVLWLLRVFGIFGHLSTIKIG